MRFNRVWRFSCCPFWNRVLYGFVILCSATFKSKNYGHYCMTSLVWWLSKGDASILAPSSEMQSWPIDILLPHIVEALFCFWFWQLLQAHLDLQKTSFHHMVACPLAVYAQAEIWKLVICQWKWWFWMIGSNHLGTPIVFDSKLKMSRLFPSRTVGQDSLSEQPFAHCMERSRSCMTYGCLQLLMMLDD